MTTIREELSNTIYWEQTYERMTLKQGFNREESQKLWKLKEIYRNDIIDKIMDGSYEWSIPRKVEIAKHESNKKRVVYLYNIEDRYILGVIYRALSVYFKNEVADNCFSYKKGENTGNAIKYIKEHRNEQLKYGVKIDIHAYFNSVSKEKVSNMIDELFSGGFKTTMQNIMLDERILWKGEEMTEWKSLIPGCALGSFFANWTLRECDNYFYNNNKVYARYSDDIIVIEDNREELEKDLNIIKEYLNKYGLEINEKKYTWFEPGDSIEYLGLKLDDNGVVDMSNHAKQKIKKQIHRWCRKGRVEIEKGNVTFDVMARRIVRRINNKNFFCAINHGGTFGWAMYLFPKITTTESLKEIDLYTKDTLRAMKTGKHNRANYKAMSEDEFHKLGWVSLVQMFHLYKQDYDYFMEVIEILM